jgi:hypothetical protein
MQMVFLRHTKYPRNEDDYCANSFTSETAPTLPAILPRSGMGYFLIDFFQVFYIETLTMTCSIMWIESKAENK